MVGDSAERTADVGAANAAKDRATAASGAKHPFLALAIGAVVAAVLGWFGFQRITNVPPIVLVRAPTDLEMLYAERARFAGAWDPATAEIGNRHLPRFPVSEWSVRQLVPIDALNQYDPQTYVRRPPNLNLPNPWKEHARGIFRVRTNSLGMRDVAEPSAVKPDLRILVTGDSHSEGVCNTFETYTKVLQLFLSKAHRGKRIEALNAAKGSFTFYSYLGTLEKFLYLEPDVFLIGVYGPNDFEEILPLFHFFEGTPRKPGAAGYWNLIEKALAIDTAWLAQDGLSLKFFQQYPAEIPVALAAAQAALLDVEELCRANGILLGVVYIPGFFDTVRRSGASEPELDALSARLYDALELAPGDVGVHDRMADELLAYLAQRKIPVLDARQLFAGQKRRFFWREDHHIDVDAQRAIGAALVPFVEAMSPPGLR